MRYAIFADIHSNLEAFQAVLDDFTTQHIDKFLCAGDIVGYAANPSECISLVKGLNPEIVAGNHDWASADLFDMSYFNLYAKDAILWTKNILSEEEKTYLKSLKLIHQESSLTLFHGSLIHPQEFHYILNVYTALNSLKLLKTDIGFFGHTHLPGAFILDKDDNLPEDIYGEIIEAVPSKKYLVNVGSVGQPRDSDPRACYCLYDTDEKQLSLEE